MTAAALFHAARAAEFFDGARQGRRDADLEGWRAMSAPILRFLTDGGRVR